MIAAPPRLRQATTFAAVGIAATLVHLGAASLAHGAGLPVQGANFAGWMTAVVVSFLGHARMTFRVEGALGPYLPRFLMVSGTAWAVSALVVAVATDAGLPFWAALALVGVTVPPASYIAQRVAVFRAGATTDPGTLLALAVGAAIYLLFKGAYVNHDVAWYLVAGRQWIEGARLYTDLSEVNPPLAFYLIRAALHLGDLFRLDAPASLAAFVGALTAGALIWVARIVPAQPHRLLPLLAFALAATLPFPPHFGQREHLMILLILPWVAAALFVEHPLDGRGAVLRGVVAGVGICLKPHFLLYPLALTLVEVLRRRSLRPVLSAGNLAMGSVGLAYVAATALLHPDYLATVVPDARLVYGAYALPLSYQLANLSPLPVGLAAAILFAGARGWAGARAVALFAAASMAYWAQGNGFTYHAAPVHALAIIGLALVAPGAARPLRLASLAATALFAVLAVTEGPYRNDLSRHLEARLDHLGLAPKRLLVWSPTLLPAFPLTLSVGADWAGHAGSLWLLPGTLDLVEDGGATDDPRRAVLARSQRQMARDIARCPDVVILDRTLPLREKPLDVLGYADAATAARVARDYILVERGPRFDILARNAACGAL